MIGPLGNWSAWKTKLALPSASSLRSGARFASCPQGLGLSFVGCYQQYALTSVIPGALRVTGTSPVIVEQEEGVLTLMDWTQSFFFLESQPT